MDFKTKRKEEENNQKGTLLSLTVHVLLGALFFLAPTHKIAAPKESQIIVELPKDLGGGVALGLKNEGSGSKAAPGKPDPNAGNSTAKPEPAAPIPTPKATPPKPVITRTPTPTPPPRKVETTEDPNAAAVRKQAEQVRKQAEEKKYQQEAETRAKRQVEQAKQAADAAAKQAAADKAAAEQAAKDKFKGRFGNGTNGGTNGGGGTGTGRGNTGKPGNQGDPSGDPNSSRLEGMGSGPGISGFGSRKATYVPRLQENSQKEGTVVVQFCVDGSGTVTSANFSAKGSTTNDGDLVDLAIRNTRQLKMEPTSADKQCGYYTYRFRVK